MRKRICGLKSNERPRRRVNGAGTSLLERGQPAVFELARLGAMATGYAAAAAAQVSGAKT